MAKYEEISYKQELLRKGIHLISLSIPITYSFVSQWIVLSILIPITLVFVFFDVLSKKNIQIRKFVHSIFGKMLRQHETGEKFTLNGASWVLISAIIVILIFPKILAVTGFAILIISDISAALVGRKIGKTPLWGKSVEGTSAFMITSFMVVIFIGYMVNAPWTYYLFGIIGGIVAGIAEAASKKIKVDDNLSIPISIGLIMWAGSIISDYYFHTPYLYLLIH